MRKYMIDCHEEETCFAFTRGLDSRVERIFLASNDAKKRLGLLEDGENLFDVIPELNSEMFDDYKLRFGAFERKITGYSQEASELSELGFEQVGRLLVPHYKSFDEE